jgi:hypothetical protein
MPEVSTENISNVATNAVENITNTVRNLAAQATNTVANIANKASNAAGMGNVVAPTNNNKGMNNNNRLQFPNRPPNGLRRNNFGGSPATNLP